VTGSDIDNDTVIYVPDGATIANYLASVPPGGTLSLASNGNYTLGAGVDGFTTLASGYPNLPTKILGNGATITGGRDGLSFIGKSDIKIYDLHFVNQTRYSISYEYCRSIDQYNCIYKSTVGTSMIDMLKLKWSQNLYFNGCGVLTSTGDSTCDGFEFWACQDCECESCYVNGITGGASPDHHGFEVYSDTNDPKCENVVWTNCIATGMDVGYSVEGGPSSLAQVNCGCNGSHVGTNTIDAQGIQGATLYIDNDEGGWTTNGSVVIRS
jgi:hypothetical protein